MSMTRQKARSPNTILLLRLSKVHFQFCLHLELPKPNPIVQRSEVMFTAQKVTQTDHQEHCLSPSPPQNYSNQFSCRNTLYTVKYWHLLQHQIKKLDPIKRLQKKRNVFLTLSVVSAAFRGPYTSVI